MAEGPNPLERLREEALAAFEPSVDTTAPSLRAIVIRSVHYAHLDRPRSEIVIDRRALLLGTVAVGLEPDHRGNTPGWFVQWLAGRLPNLDLASICAEARIPEEALAEAASGSFALVASDSVRNLLKAASGFARTTVKRDRASLRHLFLALVDDPHHKLEIEEFGWSPTAADMADLKAMLFKWIEAGPEAGENMEAWRDLLDQPAAAASPSPTSTGGPSAPPPPASPAFFVTGFSADRTTEHDGDPLETEADVLAMARLICHEDADPPISIGVFGGWGSGKSSFMEALQFEVAELAEAAAKETQLVDGPRFVSPVVQIRFTAWQFADADLWASLTAEFFDQLRAGGFQGGGKRIHAQLVEKVNEHVRGLGKEAAERRAAKARADDELRTAQAEHDEAVKRVDTDVRQAMVSGLTEAFEKNRSDLARLGLVDARSSDQLAEFIRVAKDVRTLSGQVKRIILMLIRHWTLVLGTAVALGALAWAVTKWTGNDLAGAITAIVGGAAAWLPLISSGLKAIQSVVRQTAPFADAIAEAEKKGLKRVMDSEVKLRLAAEEADALQAASDRADRALARYVDPAARANPPRVLRYLLEDDPDTKAFEKEIGLIGRARRLFQALNQIVAENRLKQEKARLAVAGQAAPDIDAPDPDIPARIIIYIDDLDRCTHEQVYKVLQAVHLLLAFELFVVVVAVDVAWIEAALAKSIEFAGAETEKEELKEAARRQRAIEYLSKIFQLPFWLRPFSGKDDERYAKYIRSLTRVTEPVGPPPPEPPPAGEEEAPEADRGADGDSRDEAPSPPPPAPPPPTRGEEDAPEAAGQAESEDSTTPAQAGDRQAVARGLKTLQLTKDEEDFLAGPEISALAASDPRGVKRLVNVYKIVRSRLSETDDTMILGGNGRAPAYPLIALFAAIETGQPLKTADAYYAALKGGAKDSTIPPTSISLIQSAVAAATTVRNGHSISAEEALAVARIVRRYSFNRFH